MGTSFHSPEGTPKMHVRPIEAIKAEYPAPCMGKQVDVDDCTESYCVGGALILAHKEGFFFSTALKEKDIHFPSNETLAVALGLLNPALQNTHAVEFAIKITDWNDRGNFHMAWKTAKEALTYTQLSYQEKD